MAEDVKSMVAALRGQQPDPINQLLTDEERPRSIASEATRLGIPVAQPPQGSPIDQIRSQGQSFGRALESLPAPMVPNQYIEQSFEDLTTGVYDPVRLQLNYNRSPNIWDALFPTNLRQKFLGRQ